MQRDGVGQRQRQRLGQLPGPRGLRGVAPLRRGLYAGQLVGGLAAVAGKPRRLPGARHGLAQTTARRHRPPVGQREGGVHEQEVGRHTGPGPGDGVVRLGGLPELGVRLGQREVACRPQTRCDGVSFGSGKRLVHQPGRVGGGAANQFGVAQQQGQIRIGEAGYVSGRVGQLRCRADEFVDAPSQPAGATVHRSEPESHVGGLERRRRTPQRLLGHARELIDLPQRPHRHDQRERRHHRVKARQGVETQCGPRILGRELAARGHRVQAGLHGQTLRRLRRGLRAGGEIFQDRRRDLRLAEDPDQVGRPHRRPVMAVCQAGAGHVAQRRLGLLAASEQHQVHRPHPGGSGRSGFGGRRGEPVGQIQIEQRHGMPRRLQVQLGIGIEVRLDPQQRTSHGGLHVGVAVFCQPRRQPPPDSRQIHLAGARAAQLTEQRVRQPGHQAGAGALDIHQAHALGGRQVRTAHHIAQHVNGQRLALRQRVDHECHSGAEPPHLARDGVGQGRRDRDVTVPHPDPGQLPHPPGRDLITEQLPQEQGVAPGQLAKPVRAAGIDRTAERAFDEFARRRGRERFEIEAGQQPVLPQRRDRVRFLTAGPHGDDQPGATRLRQLVNDQGGQPVQQVGVVDPEQHASLALLRDERVDHPAHVRQRVRQRLAERADERPQRQRTRRFGADDPLRPLAGRLGAAQHFASQPGLAHTGSSGDHHAGVLASPAQDAANDP